MMSEDMAGQAMSMAQKSAEIVVELARLLKSMYDSHRNKQINRTSTREKSYEPPNIKSGEVKLSKLKQAGEVLMQPNISTRDMETINAKAKGYDIPVSFIGKGENVGNVTLTFRREDKAVVNQILQEVMTEKLAAKPDDYLMFDLNILGEAQAMSEILKSYDIPADITIDDKGRFKCLYEAKNEEALKVIKSEVKESVESVSKDVAISKQEGKYTISDKAMGKSVTFSSLPTKDQMIKIMGEKFGYTDCKARIAANKLENELILESGNIKIGKENREKLTKLKSDIEKLENGGDAEMRRSFYEKAAADPNIEYPIYTDRNMKLVQEQMPDAVKVAGKPFWESQGYTINDNAKGVEIVAPEMDDNGKPVLDGNGNQSFIPMTVYDISETNAFEKSIDSQINSLKSEYEKTMSGIRLEYFRTDTRQVSLLNNFDRSIKLNDDSLLVKPYSFTRANFSSDGLNRYLVSNGEKAAALIPDKMSREEMENTVREKLGVSDPETVNAIVEKAEKVDVTYKVAEMKKEAEIAKQNGDIAIERRSEKFFEASQGTVKKSYDLTDKKQSVKALQNDFGVSSEKAERIFQKAQNQSTLQNDFHKMSAKSKTNSKPVKEKKTSKGART